jgi:hypothetical protein
MFHRHASVSLALLAVLAPVALADGGPNHQARQTRPISLGTSGGNVKDKTRLFCCSGTLGALVSDANGQYILSNNHVLARTNNGLAGEPVDQPGLVDNSCNATQSDYIGRLSRFVRIDFNGGDNRADCAIAQTTGTYTKAGGDILDIGQISGSIVSNPTIGLAVKKSGRTTGLTTGTVTGLNATLTVAYPNGCGILPTLRARYVGQIEFSYLSDSGDSGSLIVENASSCPRAVALLFAGSSSSTIGNPIGAALTGLGVSMVSGSCGSAAASPETIDLALRHAIDVQERVTERMLAIPGVLGTAIGADESGRFVIRVYLEKDDAAVRSQIPARFEDVPSRPIISGQFVAY